jgi:hypothetical protein
VEAFYPVNSMAEKIVKIIKPCQKMRVSGKLRLLSTD